MNRFRDEIGSEFWSVPTSKIENDCFNADTKWFLSGRSALASIISDIQSKNTVKRVAMPSWCCDSMIKPFIDAEIEVSFYPVYFENGNLKQDFSYVKNCDIVFLMDYFGYKSLEQPEFNSSICIKDLTHSIFTNQSDIKDYAFGSLRKWAGFYTGGFAVGIASDNLVTNSDYIKLRSLAMQEKEAYISGKISSKEYLNLFSKAEEMLETAATGKAYEKDIAAAKYLDVEFIKKKRRENAAILLREFADIAIFKELKKEDCPLFVPIIVPEGKRNQLRKHLIENDIYCPVHWPVTSYHKLDERTSFLYENSLSLVCDQRYSKDDMERLIKTIKIFWKG